LQEKAHAQQESAGLRQFQIMLNGPFLHFKVLPAEYQPGKCQQNKRASNLAASGRGILMKYYFSKLWGIKPTCEI
jgi:hypothetical protein